MPLRVEVAYSPQAGVVDRVEVVVEDGATLRDALRLSGLLQRHAGIDPETCVTGIWGRLRPLESPLRDADRVEVYRPLQVDPKEARRLRHATQRQASGTRKR